MGQVGISGRKTPMSNAGMPLRGSGFSAGGASVLEAEGSAVSASVEDFNSDHSFLANQPEVIGPSGFPSSGIRRSPLQFGIRFFGDGYGDTRQAVPS
jgi:hypothetical protein